MVNSCCAKVGSNLVWAMQKSPPEVWSLESYFPEFDGATYRDFKRALKADTAEVLATTDALEVLSGDTVEAWATAFMRWEELHARLGHLSSYLGCLGAADAANEAYQAEAAALSETEAALGKFTAVLKRGLASEDQAAWGTLLARPDMKDATHTLKNLRKAGRNLMSAAEENLAADLNVDGLHAWGRLYDTVSGKMEWTMAWPDGREELLSMSRRRALVSDGNREVRKSAFMRGNKAWEAAEDTMAAALNSIAGTRLTLYGRRGQPSFLDQPMHDNSVDTETVAAMFKAIADNYEVSRRILRAGAKLQGTPTLTWYDLEAPRFPSAPAVTWEEAVSLCGGAFASTYPALGDYFQSSLGKRWVEAEQRPNKRPGAFCTGSSLTAEERIYMTFNGTMSDVNTLAHEYGHAWHSHLLGDLRPCAGDYPMTLAETASTFAENLLSHGLLANPSLTTEQRAFLIDQSTNHAPGYLLNIPVRYLFEQRFYEERRAGVVPTSRIKTLMIEAQREVYGETLEQGGEDPWFWASKLHFFITELSFYNFPYTFGFLLSQALYGEFVREGAEFLPRYEAFLRLTGSASCEDAVKQSLGRDLRDSAFWASGIRALEPKIAELEALVPA
jgi:oligoendopeptidase F